MYSIPDHPDIECAMRTGYPCSYFSGRYREVDEDFEYENRRDEALLAEMEDDDEADK